MVQKLHYYHKSSRTLYLQQRSISSPFNRREIIHDTARLIVMALCTTSTVTNTTLHTCVYTYVRIFVVIEYATRLRALLFSIILACLKESLCLASQRDSVDDFSCFFCLIHSSISLRSSVFDFTMSIVSGERLNGSVWSLSKCLSNNFSLFYRSLFHESR